jgi:hypothetical protein
LRREGRFFQILRKENPSPRKENPNLGKENQNRGKENPNYFLPRIEALQRVAPTPKATSFLLAASGGL